MLGRDPPLMEAEAAEAWVLTVSARGRNSKTSSKGMSYYPGSSTQRDNSSNAMTITPSFHICRAGEQNQLFYK